MKTLADIACLLLPQIKPVAVDLQPGNGDFLRSARPGKEALALEAPLKDFAGLLDQIKFEADLFLVNPEAGVMNKDDLPFLSTCETVAAAFNSRDPELRIGEIHSVAAHLLLALHFCTHRGEGVLLSHTSTIKRLFLAPGAPHGDIARHFWVRLDTGSRTAIFFAHNHTHGLDRTFHLAPAESLEDLAKKARTVNRRSLRHGVQVGFEDYACKDTVEKWECAKSEWLQRTGQRKPDLNLWLDHGRIRTHLSKFDHAAADHAAMTALLALKDKPLESLVMDRQDRSTLMTAIAGRWRVHPELPEKVQQAIAAYRAVRAPLYPLPPIQRLAFLDEESHILCEKDLQVNGIKVFLSGERYPVECQTVLVERREWKSNYAGESQERLLSGEDMAVCITDLRGRDHLFIDGRHRKARVSQHDTEITSYLDLQTLIEHFAIPEVQSVAQTHPELYRLRLAEIDQIEALLPATGGKRFRFRQFQREDLACGTIPSGAVFAWDKGLGKTVGGPMLALLQVGRNGLCPAKPVLIVAPGHLHEQMIDDVASLGITYTPLNSQDDFTRLWLANNRSIPPGFYLTSYTQLCTNKVAKPPELKKSATPDEIADLMVELGLKFEDARSDYHSQTLRNKTLLECARDLCLKTIENGMVNVGTERGGVRCVYSPSLAELSRDAFECVIIDEGTRIKSEDSLIGRGTRLMRAKHRYVLTGTPIKNRLPDAFWLLWFAAGGHEDPTPRFPYGGSSAEQARFTSDFSVCEINLSRIRADNDGVLPEKYKSESWFGRSRGSPIPEVTNLHQLWRINAPNLLRRRKDNIGESIVRKIFSPIMVPMGTEQAEAYAHHLFGRYIDSTGRDSIIAKMTALRTVASAPTAASLEHAKGKGRHVSRFDYTPKIAATLSLIEKILRRGEQAVVFSAMRETNLCLSRYLTEAAVPHDILDGNMPEAKRGQLSKEFKQGPGRGKPIVLAGLKAMGEGANWPLCRNCILPSFDWPYDLFEQAIDRIHRLNTPEDVTIWPVMCLGTIDRKLNDLREEKRDASELVLDGRLLGEDVSQVDLGEILKIAFDEFNASDTVSEEKLFLEWGELRQAIRGALNAGVSHGDGSATPTHQKP